MIGEVCKTSVHAAAMTKVGLLHKKPLEWAGAMPTPFGRPSFEFRLECGGSLWLKSFIARLDEFQLGVAL